MQSHGTASFYQNVPNLSNPEWLSIYEQNTRAVRSNSPSWVTKFTGQCLLSRRAIKQFLESTDLQAAPAPRAVSYWQVVTVLSKSFHRTSCSEQNPQLLSARIKSKTEFKIETVCAFHQLASKSKETIRLRDVKNTHRNRFDDDNIWWMKQK